MTPEQQQQFNQMAQAIKVLTDFMASIQNDRRIPNNFEGALRNRLFDLSTLDKATFTATLSSTPGGTIVPKEPDALIELNNGYFVAVYKKLI